MKNEHLNNFPIGTVYTAPGKAKNRCTIVDTLRTYNSAGELVAFRYVATHEFCGRTVTDCDVLPFTVAMALNCLSGVLPV